MKTKDIPEYALTWALAAAHIALAGFFVYWLAVYLLGLLGLA